MSDKVTFIEVAVKPHPLPPRIGHTVTLDIGGKVYATCPGLTRTCEGYRPCTCRKARKMYESGAEDYEFMAHRQHHIAPDWLDGEYAAATGECWVVTAVHEDDHLATDFIAEVHGIPGEYEAIAYDGPAFVLDWTGRTEYQYQTPGDDHE